VKFVANGFAGVDQIVFQLPVGLSAGSHTLRLAAGVIACPPPPFAQACNFQSKAISNGVKIQVE